VNIIAVASAKGGVGKTTVTASLAVALARQTGRIVLALDLDPQNALAMHLGLDPQDLRGLSRAALGRASWRDVCVELQPGLYVLPFGAVTEQDRTRLEAQIADQPDWLERHLRALELPEDAIVLLDTPPGPTQYGQQALTVAHWVTVVLLADAGSYATLPLMQRLVQTYCVPRPDFADVLYVLNQVNSGRQLARDVMQVLREAVGERLLGAIHSDEAVAEALALGVSVLDHAPQSLARQDILQCAAALAARVQAGRACPAAQLQE